MKPKKLKPVTIRDVSALIDIMAETADILSLPQDWLETHINSRIMMTGRNVDAETIHDGVEMWRQDYLTRQYWQDIERRTTERSQPQVTQDGGEQCATHGR